MTIVKDDKQCSSEAERLKRRLVVMAETVLSTARYNKVPVWEHPQLYLEQVEELRREMEPVNNWLIWKIYPKAESAARWRVVRSLEDSANSLAIVAAQIKHYIAWKDDVMYGDMVRQQRLILADVLQDLRRAEPLGYNPNTDSALVRICESQTDKRICRTDGVISRGPPSAVFLSVVLVAWFVDTRDQHYCSQVRPPNPFQNGKRKK